MQPEVESVVLLDVADVEVARHRGISGLFSVVREEQRGAVVHRPARPQRVGDGAQFRPVAPRCCVPGVVDDAAHRRVRAPARAGRAVGEPAVPGQVRGCERHDTCGVVAILDDPPAVGRTYGAVDQIGRTWRRISHRWASTARVPAALRCDVATRRAHDSATAVAGRVRSREKPTCERALLASMVMSLSSGA